MQQYPKTKAAGEARKLLDKQDTSSAGAKKARPSEPSQRVGTAARPSQAKALLVVARSPTVPARQRLRSARHGTVRRSCHDQGITRPWRGLTHPPPNEGISGQMAKCRVWPCDRFLPRNIRFSHLARVDLASEGLSDPVRPPTRAPSRPNRPVRRPALWWPLLAMR